MKNIIFLIFVFLIFSNCSVRKTDLQFKKIIFHTSKCWGTCPEYHLELNNKKEIKLYVEKAYQKRKIDTTKMGYYKGKINSEVYNEFLSILSRIDIEKSGVEQPYIAPNTILINNEGSQLSLILYANNKRKPIIYLYPTGIYSELRTYLYKLIDDENLYKVKENFEIEPLK